MKPPGGPPGRPPNRPTESLCGRAAAAAIAPAEENPIARAATIAVFFPAQRGGSFGVPSPGAEPLRTTSAVDDPGPGSGAGTGLAGEAGSDWTDAPKSSVFGPSPGGIRSPGAAVELAGEALAGVELDGDTLDG